VAVTTAKNTPGAGLPPPNGLLTPRRANPRRRSPVMVSLGVLLVVLGALGAWRYVGLASSGTHPYVAVYRPVPLGAQITADDVQIVSITKAAGLNPIPGDELNQVIGKYARVELVAGTLLTPQDLTNQAPPGPGQALIGLNLKVGQRPVRELHAGDHVVLVALPDTTGLTTGTAPPAPPAQIAAIVVDVAKVRDDGSQVVDVTVGTGDFATVAALANSGRIAVALVGGG
jgi:hypothetical protein